MLIITPTNFAGLANEGAMKTGRKILGLVACSLLALQLRNRCRPRR
jgi:hypothetical protein